MIDFIFLGIDQLIIYGNQVLIIIEMTQRASEFGALIGPAHASGANRRIAREEDNTRVNWAWNHRDVSK